MYLDINEVIPSEHHWFPILITYIIIIGIYYLCNKIWFKQKIFVFSKVKIKYEWVILLLCVLFLTLITWLLFQSNWDKCNISTILDAVLPGVFEEFIFRGIILSLAIKMLITWFPKSKITDVFIAIILSSFLFGITHFVNIFFSSMNPSAVTLEILFATSVGIINAVIYLRTKNLWLIMLMHSLWDLVNSIAPLDIAGGFFQQLACNFGFLVFSLLFMFLFIRKNKINVDIPF